MQMQFTGIRLIQLAVPPTLPAIAWKQAEQQQRRRPFNGLHLSAQLEAKVADACAPRRVQPLANTQIQIAETQTSAVEVAAPVAPVALLTPPVAPKRRSLVAVRQALLQLGVSVTRIAELTGTDRRSAHKHAHATPSSKVKNWADRSEAERAQATEMARELL